MVHLPHVNVNVISKDDIHNNNINNNNINNNNNVANDDNYDPFKHREANHLIADWRALFTLLKTSLGSGILAMPLAFSCAGLIVGSIGTLLIGLVCTHCAQILVEQSQLICRVVKKPCLNYGETLEQAFRFGPKSLRKHSNAMKIFTDFALAFTYLGANCVYVALMTNSIKQLVEDNFDLYYSPSIYCLILAIPLILMVQIRHLKHLAPFSAAATMFLVIVCGITFYFIFKDGISFENRVPYTDITKLPLFISTVIFAMEGIGVVMPIENKMANPSHFLGCPGVLNIAMVAVVSLYASLGFFGYVKYGDNALGSITLNLDTNSISAKIAKILVVIAIFFTYPVQYFVFSDIVWLYLKPKVSIKYTTAIQSLFLSAGVIVTLLTGALLPKIDSLIELVGSIFFSTLGLLFPALIETIFQWERNLGIFKWKLWKNILIILFSLTALACGVHHAIISIIND